jgi:hypothetical protein
LSEAARYYRLSADQGNVFSQLNYGRCLEFGKGVSIDLNEAAKYYKLSADQGHAQAQFYYGVLLDTGGDVLMNKSLATHYFKLSADQENAQAQSKYGVLLARDEGISMNKSLAAHCFKLSAAQGNAQTAYPQEVDFIIGIDAPSIPKASHCFVKFVDRSYASSRWIKFKIVSGLINGPESIDALKSYEGTFTRFQEILYLHIPDFVKLSLSYFQAEEIITAEGGMFLVKWCDLDITYATWEHFVPPELFDDWRQKSARTVPIKKTHVLDKRDPSSDYRQAQSPAFKNGHRLFPNQVDCLNWLTHCWNNRQNCILSDENGLGMVIEAVAFLDTLRQRHNIYGPFLIVSTTHRVYKWKSTIEEWSDFKLHVLLRPGPFLLDYFFPIKDDGNPDRTSLMTDIFLFSYQAFEASKSAVSQIDFMCVILDEWLDKNCELGLLEKFSADHVLLTTPRLASHYTDLSAFCSEPPTFTFVRHQDDVPNLRSCLHEIVVRAEMSEWQQKRIRAIFLTHRAKLQKKQRLDIIIRKIQKRCNTPGKATDQFFEIGKIVVLDKLLNKCKELGWSVLILGQSQKVLDLLESFVSYKEYKYERLSGAPSHTPQVRFCHDLSTFVFLSCACWTISLISARVVILYDWNDSTEEIHSSSHVDELYRLVTRGVPDQDLSTDIDLDSVLRCTAQYLKSADANTWASFSDLSIDEILSRTIPSDSTDDDPPGFWDEWFSCSFQSQILPFTDDSFAMEDIYTMKTLLADYGYCHAIAMRHEFAPLAQVLLFHACMIGSDGAWKVHSFPFQIPIASAYIPPFDIPSNREKLLRGASQFLCSTAAADRLYTIVVWLSNEEFDQTSDFAPFHPTPLGWTPFHDFALLASFVDHGYDSGEQVKSESFLVQFKAKLSKADLFQRRDILLKILHPAVPVIYDTNSKGIVSVQEFASQHPNLRRLRVIPDFRQKQLLHYIYLTGLPHTVDDLRQSFAVSAYSDAALTSFLASIWSLCHSHFPEMPLISSAAPAHWIPDDVGWMVAIRCRLFHHLRTHLVDLQNPQLVVQWVDGPHWWTPAADRVLVTEVAVHGLASCSMISRAVEMVVSRMANKWELSGYAELGEEVIARRLAVLIAEVRRIEVFGNLRYLSKSFICSTKTWWFMSQANPDQSRFVIWAVEHPEIHAVANNQNSAFVAIIACLKEASRMVRYRPCPDIAKFEQYIWLSE